MDQESGAVYLACSRPETRTRLSGAIGPFYALSCFDSGPDLVRELDQTAPSAIVVAEGLRPDGAINFIRDVRARSDMAFLPILFVGHSQDRVSAIRAVNDGASAYIWSSASDTAIIQAVRRVINKRIEDNWEGLATTPKQALKHTLRTLRRVSEAMREGKPLDVEQVEHDCRPLVDCAVQGDIPQLLSAIKDYDDDTYVHSLRAGAFLAWFGYGIGLRDGELLTLATGGLLHDIGKIHVPVGIIAKPGKLDPDELALVRRHVTTAMPVLDTARNLSRGVRLICANHHERLDGSGYPNNLKSDDIDDLSRMAAIVDVYSAITDRRSYKQARSDVDAFDVLRRGTTLYDQILVEAFRDRILALD